VTRGRRLAARAAPAAARGAAPCSGLGRPSAGLCVQSCGVCQRLSPGMPGRRGAGAQGHAAVRRPERRCMCAALLMPAKLEAEAWPGCCCCPLRPMGAGCCCCPLRPMGWRGCAASARLELLPALPRELQPHLAKVVVRAHDAAAAHAVQRRACIPRHPGRRQQPAWCIWSVSTLIRMCPRTRADNSRGPRAPLPMSVTGAQARRAADGWHAPPMWVAAMPVAAVTATLVAKSSP